MNITAFLGSPDKNGNNAILIETLLNRAAARGYTTEVVPLYDLNIKGCIGCNECKFGTVEFCSQKDDMQPLYRKIVASDIIIFSSPVYFGHFSGPAKTFLDRWCTFFSSDFKPRYVIDKKIVTILTCGAPAETYQNLREYNRKLFCEFFQMQQCGNFVFGELMESGDIRRFPELLKSVETMGNCL